MLHCVTLCYTALHCVTLCYTVLHCVTLCYTVLHCVTLCYTVLHCVTLCYKRVTKLTIVAQHIGTCLEWTLYIKQTLMRVPRVSALYRFQCILLVILTNMRRENRYCEVRLKFLHSVWFNFAEVKRNYFFYKPHCYHCRSRGNIYLLVSLATIFYT